MNRWRTWARELQAIAQIGLEYSRDPYDRERYEQIREIAVDLASVGTGVEPTVLREAFAAQDGYATPKFDTRVAVFDDAGRVMLVRDAGDGGWSYRAAGATSTRRRPRTPFA